MEFPQKAANLPIDIAANIVVVAMAVLVAVLDIQTRHTHTEAAMEVQMVRMVVATMLLVLDKKLLQEPLESLTENCSQEVVVLVWLLLQTGTMTI